MQNLTKLRNNKRRKDKDVINLGLVKNEGESKKTKTK